jgi:hypothetical protein
MKRISWAALVTVGVVVVLAGLAGKDDIKKFLQMHNM